MRSRTLRIQPEFSRNTDPANNNSENTYYYLKVQIDPNLQKNMVIKPYRKLFSVLGADKKNCRKTFSKVR